MNEWIPISEYDKKTHGNEVTVKTSETDLFIAVKSDSGTWFTEFPDGGLRTCSPIAFKVNNKH